MNLKTVKIYKADGSTIVKQYLMKSADILNHVGRFYGAQKVNISGLNYIKTGAGFTCTGRY